jgi:hypothetical protein
VVEHLVLEHEDPKATNTAKHPNSVMPHKGGDAAVLDGKLTALLPPALVERDPLVEIIDRLIRKRRSLQGKARSRRVVGEIVILELRLSEFLSVAR